MSRALWRRWKNYYRS